MISRRNIRIDVLQTIYALTQQDAVNPHDVAQNRILKRIEETSALLVVNLHLMMRLSAFILNVANKRASKMIRTLDDEQVNIKLADNQYTKLLAGNSSYTDLVKKYVRPEWIDEEFLKKVFIPFTETPEYINYIASNSRDMHSEKAILIHLFDVCISRNELTQSFLEEHFIYASTDQEMIGGWLDKVLTHASSFNFNRILSDEKVAFACDLITSYFNKKEVVFNLIEPKLVNWDADRVAILDLIILHLGICELLYFEQIPEKVTINEYIDLAKLYSTQQSGQFVNGLLDNVRKELHEENKIIKKSGRNN
jgi:N utilization substance protein B